MTKSWQLFGISLLAAFVAVPAFASSPKQVAPIDVRLEVLAWAGPSKPAKLRLTAKPGIDAPVLRLMWLLPDGVLAENGPVTWSGPAHAGTTAELTVTVRAADLTPRTILAGATLEWPDGRRQVRTESLDLPPGTKAKTSANPPVTRNSRGEPIVEHLVPGPGAR